MTSTFNGDFARLVPHNYFAQRLFSSTYMSLEKTKDTIHLKFINIDRTNRQETLVPEEPVESSTDYDTQYETDWEDRNVPGHFILSFHADRSPEKPQLGWRAGRGHRKLPNRGVDLMLAKPGDGLSKSLANVHMLFRFNPRSGMLMLQGGSQKAPVEYKVGDKWKELGHNKEQLVYQPCTYIRAGRCEYSLEYTIDERDREIYFRLRDDFLQTTISEPYYSTLRKLPGENCIVRGRYLELETRGTGAFGWINQGVDITTGDPIAIKELRINGENAEEARAEVNLGLKLLNQRGVLPILGAMCEHGQSDVCCRLEKFFIFMPLASSDFSRNFWQEPNTPRTVKLGLLREPLEGLKVLHDMGIMHRDIRRRNTLILADFPPRAVLCDYGKAIEAQSSRMTTIGPVYTCAPEVWTVATDGPYNSKVDTWAYGYTMAEVLGYRNPDNARITRMRHASIISMLREHCKKAPEDKPIVDLIMKLMTWKPRDRWSAEQALEHECWLPLIQEREEAKEPIETPEPKRIHLEEPVPKTDPEAHGAEEHTTQAFSEESLAIIARSKG